MLIVGDHSYGAEDIKHIYVPGTITIGKYCSIAAGVQAFWGISHNTKLLSTFPFKLTDREIYPLIRTKALSTTAKSHNAPIKDTITIGNDVWIGYGAILFAGVTIGDGVAIGAFTKVTKDIPPYAIVVGESRIIKYRFSEEDIEFLLKLKWWDFPDQEVADIWQILYNPDVNILRKWSNDKYLL